MKSHFADFLKQECIKIYNDSDYKNKIDNDWVFTILNNNPYSEYWFYDNSYEWRVKILLNNPDHSMKYNWQGLPLQNGELIRNISEIWK